MVRFNRNRWYSSENQQQMRRKVARNSSGGRRLVSLVFLLALVLLLMQKVSDPGNVRRAFQSIGVSLEREPLVGTEPNGGEDLSVSSFQDFSNKDSNSLDRDPAVLDMQNGNSADGLQEEPKPQPKLDAAWLATCRDLLPRILSTSSATTIDLFARYTFGNTASEWDTLRPTEMSAEIDSFAESAQTLVAQFSEGIPNQSTIEDEAEKPEVDSGRDDPTEVGRSVNDKADWQALLQRFSVEWSVLLNTVEQFHLGEGDEETVDILASPEMRLALEEALDDKLMARLIDAAPWRQSENVSFWRLLQRCRNLDYGPDIDARIDKSKRHGFEIIDPTRKSFHRSIPLISTQQLQADFLQRRGTWIRFQGTVHRAEYVQRSSPLFETKGYWLLWLQGADGASQPVGVFTELEHVREFNQAVSRQDFPEVELIGLVGKRLAYASKSGVQISPTIFACSISQTAAQKLPSKRDSATSLTKLDVTRLTSAVVTALILSCLAVVPIWKTLRHRTLIRSKSAVREKQKHTLGSGSAIWLLLMLTNQEQAICSQLAPPWANPNEKSRTIAGVAEQLFLAAFNDEAWQAGEAMPSQDGQFATDDLLRIMHACERIGWEQASSIDQGISLGNDYVLKPMQIDGWVHQCRALQLSESQQNWFSKVTRSAIYELNLTSGDGENKLSPVYCVSVPKFWLDAGELAQPTVVKGLVLLRRQSDTTEIDDQASVVCMFVEQPQWKTLKHSTDVEIKLNPELPASWKELAELGWNLTWIDQVRSLNEESLASSEREPFLTLLRIVGEAGFEPKSSGIAPMEVLRSSEQHVGCCVDWKVRLVAGNLVQYPGTHDGNTVSYFQFDGFVKIPGQRVDYVPANGHERIRFEGEFPVTIVMAGVSEFVPKNLTKNGEFSWKVGQHAQIKGRFYRMWSYRSERLQDDSEVGRQIAPLIIGASLISAPPDIPQSGPVGWFGAAMGVGVLLVLSGIIAMVFKDTFRSPS